MMIEEKFQSNIYIVKIGYIILNAVLVININFIFIRNINIVMLVMVIVYMMTLCYLNWDTLSSQHFLSVIVFREFP